MLAVKYQSKRISQFSPEELHNYTMALLFRIHTITGWKLPDDEFFLNTLVSEFEKFLQERYPDLNPDEITYSFRNYGTTVKDWGKSMNLSLIDEPIQKYLSVRRCLSDMEERKEVPAIETEKPQFEPDEFLQSVKGVFLLTKNVGLISVRAYEILEQRKEIELSNEEKAEIRKKVEARLNTIMHEGPEEDAKELKMLNKRDYEIRVRNECKKQVVADYFLKQSAIDNF
jgi:hypothetical protein